MAINNFIPEVWSAAILEALRPKLVYGSLCNRDYQGDIADKGDTVHITGYNDITVKKYERGTDITVESASDKDAGTLTIDQADYFAFKVNDLDKAQAVSDMTGKFAASAAYNMAASVEKYLSGLMDKAVPAAAASMTHTDAPSKAYEAIVAAGVALDKANVPSEGRWIVVSPDFYALLLQDSRFISGTESGHGTLLNGVVGHVTGFTVVKSNNVPVDSTGKIQSIIAGTNIATTFAQQVNKVEAMRMQTDFADMVRGVDLYGGLVVRPEALTKIKYTYTDTVSHLDSTDETRPVADDSTDDAEPAKETTAASKK